MKNTFEDTWNVKAKTIDVPLDMAKSVAMTDLDKFKSTNTSPVEVVSLLVQTKMNFYNPSVRNEIQKFDNQPVENKHGNFFDSIEKTSLIRN